MKEDPIYKGYADLAWRDPVYTEKPLTALLPKEPKMPNPKSSNKTVVRAKRSRTGAQSRINADNIWLYRFISVGVIAGALAAFATSWAGLLYVAQWQALPAEWQWLTPVMIDIPIVVLTLAALAKRSRGENHWWFVSFAIFLTALSGVANFSHTADVRGLQDYTDWIGAILNTVAPAFVLLTTEVLGSLVTRPVKKDTAKK